MDPLELFALWYSQELQLSKARIPSACCLSTSGLDGFPNARFVSLKNVMDDAFIITGSLGSRKGPEIQQSVKVALTFWWPVTERQVRVQGEASLISGQQADKYFSERDLESQVVSLVSDQGREIEDMEGLKRKFREELATAAINRPKRPDDWGGYSIKPVRIELMEFKSTRLHERNLFELINGKWMLKRLQP